VTCAVCGRAVDTPARLPPRKAVLCGRCNGLEVVVVTAGAERLGSRTFYVSSASRPGVRHTVKLVRRELRCTCENYTHVGQVLRQPCRHTRIVRLLGHAAGGVRRLPLGRTLRFRLGQPAGRR
jgi:hypothetical protein